jgi:carbon monoxide dehydrogenase subunit G
MRWYDLRKVDMGFMDAAEKTYVMEGMVRAPRAQVWAAISDPTTWASWFPGVRSASYLGEPPYGVGSRRIADMGSARYEETMLVWNEPSEWVYRIDRSTLPIANAQVESTLLEDAGHGTKVRWVLATDRRLLLKVSAPFLRRGLDRMWASALDNLGAYLARR